MKGANIINAQNDSPKTYQSYLLRLWQEANADRDESPCTEWRCSLEEIGGLRRRLGFGSLDALIAFLEAQVGEASAEPGD